MNNLSYFINKSQELRLRIFNKFCQTRQGHPGSIYSMLDLIVGLYYGNYIKFDKKNNEYLDKVIISKGHATSCLYPILEEKGVIKSEDWNNWGVKDSELRIFANNSIPGIDVTTGSLGHGIGIGAGYAYSFKERGSKSKVYVVISEGELYEGSIWESLLFINHYQLNNLHIIIDRNNLIVLGDTEDHLKLEPIDKKLEAFGFDTRTINGHDFNEILTTYDEFFSDDNNKNNCIIANTIKGKGISKFENKVHWHYWNYLSRSELNRKEEEEIIKELNGISER